MMDDLVLQELQRGRPQPAPRGTGAVAQTMPEHVKRHLETIGVMDADTGATEKARVIRCPKCRRAIFIAWPRHSTVVRCDTRPLTAYGEIIARLEGKGTHTLRARGIGATELALIWRDKSTMEGNPADHPEIDVLIEHECGDEFERIPRQASVFDRRLHQPTPEEPPF